MSDRDAKRWEITFDEYDEEDELRRGALLAIGNGLLSCRASAPEAAAQLPEHDWKETRYAGLYRAGWYDEAPREVNGTTVNMASLTNLPDPFGLSFSIRDDEWFDLPKVDIRSFHQVLNLYNGTHERHITFSWHGTEFRLREIRFVSMADPEQMVLRWELQAPSSVSTLRIRATLDGSVRNALVERNHSYEGQRLMGIRHRLEEDGRAAVTAHLHDPAYRVGVAVQTQIEGQVPTWTGREEKGWLVQEIDCFMPDDGPLIIEKRAIVQVDDELPADDQAAREQLLQRLPDSSFESLLQQHCASWHQLWERTAISAADPRMELALRLHTYHLMQTVSPHAVGHDLGCPPRTWQEGYYGQVFWDELFAFPFLSTHCPALALELLDHRHKRLGTAKARAERAGFRGAMYPWRSGRSGEDETPPFQYYPPSGRWVPDPTCLQRHIGSAIAYDVWTLYLATGDTSILGGFGGDLVLEVARFWGSFVEFDEERGRYNICGVIGPDEYHNGYPGADEPGLNNNAYTNLTAVWTLSCALEIVDMLPEALKQPLLARLGVTNEELRHWDDITRRMYVPFAEGAIGQFEGFDDLRKPPEDWLKDGNRERLDWMLEEKNDSADRYQLTKQADGLMLLHLFSPPVLLGMIERLGYPADGALIQRTLEYHLSHITHESSLSNVTCAGASALVDPEQSWEFFSETLSVDMRDEPDKGTMEGVHLGAMAGSLDVLQRHYLGIQPEREGLRFEPAAPKQLPDVATEFLYRGSRMHIELKGEVLTLTSDSANTEIVRILHEEGNLELLPGHSISSGRTKHARKLTA